MPDFNGDKFADFADLNAGGTFWTHVNLGNGTFATGDYNWGQTMATSSQAWRSLAADFNGDGRADFADLNATLDSGSSGHLWVHFNHGPSGYSHLGMHGSTAASTDPGIEVLPGDFNCDGSADILERNVRTGALRVLRNSRAVAPYSFVPDATPAFRTMVGPEWAVRVADFNGDGCADVADYRTDTSELWVHMNLARQGRIDFDISNYAYAKGLGVQPFKMIVGDFTGDGFADFADYKPTTGEFWIHRNLRNGTFDAADYGYGKGFRPDLTWKLLGEW
jgi:hypothetical protein